MVTSKLRVEVTGPSEAMVVGLGSVELSLVLDEGQRVTDGRNPTLSDRC